MAKKTKTVAELNEKTLVKNVKAFTEGVEAFVKGEKGDRSFTKINMTIEWMNLYVTTQAPDTVDEYVNAKIEIVKNSTTDTTSQKANVKAIREYFVKRYFPDCTDEAIKERVKAAKEAKKKQAEAEAKAEADKPIEDKIREEMAALVEKHKAK